MALFQKSILKKYIAMLDEQSISEKWESYKNHFLDYNIQENIRNSKEEQYQEGFLRDLFVNILGYTLNPTTNFNLTTEYKNIKDSKKADGAIIIGGKVLGVIELKGTNTTDLNKIEAQAFGYKNNQPNCLYVISSNFEKLRFYIDNTIDFLEFNLFNLHFEDFKLLYLCLSLDSIEKNIPKKIKQESISAEENITKQLYKDYSLFKRELFANLCQLNPDIEQIILFKKSQKLLDRFLFLLFAEDCHLLPANSVRKILADWEKLKELDAYTPLYDRFKQYFGYLNQGNAERDIFAYNGGLFKPDEILDNAKISDDILYRNTKKLSDYDFNSEVDVNILGHIFENSLNEIEEIQSQIQGNLIEKSQTKRKKDGVFYTPKYITQYIVEHTIGKICDEKKQELKLEEKDFAQKQSKKNKETLLQKLKNYRNWLLQLSIIDPACGSGAFLNEALNFLIKEHQYLDELESKLFGSGFTFPNIENSILENNLFGVDINEESVEIAKLSLWLRTAQRGRKLNDLSHNIKCGNSLIDDPSVAGEKAFVWKKEFPKVFEKGGFDVVIGNPPYVNAKGENFSQTQKDFYYKHYKTAVYQIDTYILFIEKLKTLLKENGVASYIVPNAWLNNLLLADVRKFVLENFQLTEIVNTPSGVFSDATVDTVIFGVANNDERECDVLISKANGYEISLVQQTNQTIYAKNKNFIIDIFSNHSTRVILDKMLYGIRNTEYGILLLGDICDMSSGIKEYEVGKGKPKQTLQDKQNSVFNADYKKDETFLPHITGSEINRYILDWNNQYLSYGEWLGAPRQKKYFEGERLIIREIPSKTGLIVAYTDEVYTVKNSAHICRAENPEFNLKYILTLLNSRLMGFYFKYKFSEFDDVFPKAKIGQCKQLPIKDIPLSEQQPFISKAEQMLKLNKDLQNKKQKFLRRLGDTFGISKFSKKLENFWDLAFSDFVKELKKAKINLSLKEQDDWEDYFLAYQKEIGELNAQIQQTDQAINSMVYQLYGLSEEEIELVNQ